MVQLDAGIIGPDGLGGAYKNTANVREAAWWHAMGAQQGVIKGMVVSGVPGSMALSVAAGAVLVSRRDGSNNVQDMGYLVPVPTATTVTFGPASASARNDALVAAVVDTTDGAVGTGALANGGQLVAVPGVSGTATPRTDAQIAAYLGRGGYVRLADVPIASTDTQINTANLTLASPYNVVDTGWITLSSATLTGTVRYRKLGNEVYVQADGTAATVSGTVITLASTVLPTWARPSVTARFGAYFTAFAGIMTVGTDGSITAVQNTGGAKSSISSTGSFPVG